VLKKRQQASSAQETRGTPSFSSAIEFAPLPPGLLNPDKKTIFNTVHVLFSYEPDEGNSPDCNCFDNTVKHLRRKYCFYIVVFLKISNKTPLWLGMLIV
jgi:hypothetical protein